MYTKKKCTNKKNSTDCQYYFLILLFNMFQYNNLLKRELSIWNMYKMWKATKINFHIRLYKVITFKFNFLFSRFSVVNIKLLLNIINKFILVSKNPFSLFPFCMGLFLTHLHVCICKSIFIWFIKTLMQITVVIITIYFVTKHEN